MRLIDADKLKRTIAFTDAECLYDNNGKYLTEVIQLIQDKIDEQPTLETEEKNINNLVNTTYTEAYNIGYDEGYDKGYDEGYTEGFEWFND